MNTTQLRLLVLSCGALLLLGCVGMDGSTGTSPGIGSPAPQPAGPATLSGTVRSVNTAARTLTIGSAAGTQLNLRGSDDTVLTYDGYTVVQYQGQTSYKPEDLEIGDRIEVQVDRNPGYVLARNITVLSSVSAGVGGGSTTALTNWEASVRAVNPASRTMDLVQAGREQYPLTIHYDANTRVESAGRSYGPEYVERNDQVQVSTRSIDGRLIAERIVVTNNANGSAAVGTDRQLSGTIRSVDTAARVIDLESVTFAQLYGQGFDAVRNGGYTTITYDAGTVIEYRGQRYGVTNLERGDFVNVDVSQINDGYLARHIAVAEGR